MKIKEEFTQEEIQMLVNFGMQNTNPDDSDRIIKVKKRVEMFLSLQSKHFRDWVEEGNDIDSYVSPQEPLVLEALRLYELEKTQNELSELKDYLESLEDPLEFEGLLDFMAMED